TVVVVILRPEFMDFVPHASMDTAHHMLLYGCRTPYSTKGYWDCGTEQGTCEDEAKIMYAWARNAPPTKLPKDVGFKVGGDTRITYFVLQIHYGDVKNFRDHHRDCSGLTLRMTSKPQPYIAGMYLMMSVDTVIPPGNAVTNADIACTYQSYPIHPFAFRTHTHRLGKVVSGYRVRNGQWTLIGRQSPQLPQAFYPASNDVEVKYGDILAARCVFTGEGRTTKTRIGGTSSDEMCNFYIMYYMDNKHSVPYMDCMDHGNSNLFRNIPNEANIPIPVSPDHKMSMMHGSAHKGTLFIMLQQPKREEEEVLDQGAHLEELDGWPEVELQLGQVSGLALDSDDNLVIFHRGDHRWGVNSFDNSAIYQQKSLGPIQQSTILVVDPVKGNVLKASGRNMFYLPHGITTDKDNNYWVTDVALHQVFKLSKDEKEKPLLVLGEAFKPGNDRSHFCQPTDVAVDPETGNVFVSDGYCNSRILKFSPEGRYLSDWGAGSVDRRRRVPFQIPHSLAFLPDKRELLVADRENGRVQCFMADTGEFVKEIKRDEFGGEVFAVSYAPVHGGLVYVVNGESPYGHSAPLQGFVLNYSTNEILDTFAPDTQKFKMPHDIVVTKDGSVFVGDAAADSVIKFVPSEKVQEKKPVPAQQEKTPEEKEKEKGKIANKASAQGLSPGVITTLLLLLPLVLVIAIGVFIRWKKSRMYGGNKHRDRAATQSKAAGTLNLGNFFATHKGYTRQGFDRLSTEGSDLEKDDEDATDSENEEYSAPPPPVSASR
uniref:Peptidylglycine alpha-amidating monooxygenase n=1 Tax=Pygocentrus nattereri TaxID=42514 RepID=A0AAR2IRW8_PYGNA